MASNNVYQNYTLPYRPEIKFFQSLESKPKKKENLENENGENSSPKPKLTFFENLIQK